MVTTLGHPFKHDPTQLDNVRCFGYARFIFGRQDSRAGQDFELERQPSQSLASNRSENLQSGVRISDACDDRLLLIIDLDNDGRPDALAWTQADPQPLLIANLQIVGARDLGRTDIHLEEAGIPETGQGPTFALPP